MTRSTLCPETVPSGPTLVQLIELLRVEAATPVVEVFHRRSELAARIPGWNRTVISRARKAATCNPLYRTALLVLAARLGGLPRSAGERLAAFPATVVDMLWSMERASLSEMMQREQLADSREDEFQVDYLVAPSADTLRNWLAGAEKHAAELNASIAVARAKLLEMERSPRRAA